MTAFLQSDPPSPPSHPRLNPCITDQWVFVTSLTTTQLDHFRSREGQAQFWRCQSLCRRGALIIGARNMTKSRDKRIGLAGGSSNITSRGWITSQFSRSHSRSQTAAKQGDPFKDDQIISPVKQIAGNVKTVIIRYNLKTGPDGAVVMSSDNGLVDTGFVSRYRLQHRAGLLKAQWVGARPLHPLLSH